jgi:hypothetical protein
VTVELPTIDAAELYERVRRPGTGLEIGHVVAWLREWERRRLVVELEPGAWTITPRGLFVARSLALVAVPETHDHKEAA